MAPKLPDLNLSDSDYEDEVDIEDDDAPVFGKNKPKGKDASRSREIGGGKDVSDTPLRIARVADLFFSCDRRDTLGKLPIPAHGMRYGRMKVGACKVSLRICSREVEEGGKPV